MIKDKRGPVYTLCPECTSGTFIPCLNVDLEPCDCCGIIAKEVTYSSSLERRISSVDTKKYLTNTPLQK